MSGNPNKQFLRGLTESSDLGTPGSGLSGPEQFKGWLRLARERHDYLEKMASKDSLFVTSKKTGGIPRLTVASGIIRAAAEGATPTNTVKPTHSNRGYSLAKHRVDLELSDDAVEFAAVPVDAATGEDGDADYEGAVVAELADAWGLDILRLWFLGDTTSVDPSLSIHDGFVKVIQASGNEAAGALLGTSLNPRHLSLMRQTVPTRFKSRMSRYEYIMSTDVFEELIDNIAQRATGMGDQVLSKGADGSFEIYGRPVNFVDALGNTVLFDDPMNLIGVVNNRDWSLKMEDRGEYAVRGVKHMYGHLYSDTVIADPAGSVYLSGLT